MVPVNRRPGSGRLLVVSFKTKAILSSRLALLSVGHFFFMLSCFSPHDGKTAIAAPGITPACTGGGTGKGTMTDIRVPFIRKSEAFLETSQQTQVYTSMARLCLCQCPTSRTLRKCVLALSSYYKGRQAGEKTLEWICTNW